MPKNSKFLLRARVGVIYKRKNDSKWSEMARNAKKCPNARWGSFIKETSTEVPGSCTGNQGEDISLRDPRDNLKGIPMISIKYPRDTPEIHQGTPVNISCKRNQEKES